MKISLLLLAFLFLPVLAEAREDVACTMQYAPVCGTENGTYKTYGNSCVLGAERGLYQHEGECTAAELAGKQEGTYTPPAHCTAWFDGCNSCSRMDNGQAACTLMACVDTPRAGYCRVYGDTEVEVPTPPQPQISEEPEQATVTVEATSTPAEPTPGFFMRIWASIVEWFDELF